MVVHQESTFAEMNLDDVIQIDGIDYNADTTSDMDHAREWVAEK